MNKLLQLTLISALAATTGFASTTHNLAGGIAINGGSSVVLPSGHVLANTTTSYTANQNIDVLIGTDGGSSGTTDNGGLKANAGDKASALASGTTAESGGTLSGSVARHWHHGGTDWTGSSSTAWVIGSSAGGAHGFISKGLNLADSNTTLYEVFDNSENKLARIYRDMTVNNDAIGADAAKITTDSNKYAYLSTNVGSIADTDLCAGEYGYDASSPTFGTLQTFGTVHGPASVTPAATFKVDISDDGVVSADSVTDNAVRANISANLAPAISNPATGLQLLTGSSKTLHLTGTNTNLTIPLTIGSTGTGATAGLVTMGAASGSSSADALGGITTITANSGSLLTLASDDEVATGEAWTFDGTSKLTANGKITVSHPITFAAAS